MRHRWWVRLRPADRMTYLPPEIGRRSISFLNKSKPAAVSWFIEKQSLKGNEMRLSAFILVANLIIVIRLSAVPGCLRRWSVPRASLIHGRSPKGRPGRLAAKQRRGGCVGDCWSSQWFNLSRWGELRGKTREMEAGWVEMARARRFDFVHRRRGLWRSCGRSV